MKKYFLKSKNLIIKLVLTFFGFTLATSQCLAQYMAFDPRPTVFGKLKGITDTISRFRIVINKTDTNYSTWENKYTFIYSKEIRLTTDTIQVSQDIDNGKQLYLPTTTIFALKPEEIFEYRKELTIELKKKD